MNNSDLDRVKRFTQNQPFAKVLWLIHWHSLTTKSHCCSLVGGAQPIRWCEPLPPGWNFGCKFELNNRALLSQKDFTDISDVPFLLMFLSSATLDDPFFFVVVIHIIQISQKSNKMHSISQNVEITHFGTATTSTLKPWSAKKCNAYHKSTQAHTHTQDRRYAKKQFSKYH